MQNKSPSSGISLARALSKLGVASRTLAAQWIAAGRVQVNGAVVREPQRRIDIRRDRILVDKTLVRPPEKVYVALHKPAGLVCTRQDEKGRETVYACLGELAQTQLLSPVGRLDKASSGLLLLTNDTRWAAAITDPASHVAKTYHVQINRRLDEEALARLREGMVLDDGKRTQATQVRILRQGEKTQWLEFVLEEGMNRQIRRMLAIVDAEVLRLVRVAIGSLLLGDLAKGQYRLLSSAEVTDFSHPLRSPASPLKP